MSVPTSRASYKKHAYSGARKSLKRVRGGLRKFNAQESRLAWRSEEKKKKPVPITAPKTQLRTYARVKPKIHLEATYSAPSNSTVTAKLMVKPLEINWLQVDPEILTETLAVKIEQPENMNIDEPEIFVPAPLKTEPRDYDDNNEQVTTDPISLEIKTEPQEYEIPIVTQELTKPGTSKHKERERTRTSQNTSTQQPTQGESSTASTSRNILMVALEQSSLLEGSEFNTEEIDVHEEGFIIIIK